MICFNGLEKPKEYSKITLDLAGLDVSSSRICSIIYHKDHKTYKIYENYDVIRN